jgi:hypothetical protein
MYFSLDFLVEKNLYTRVFLGYAPSHGLSGPGPKSAPDLIYFSYYYYDLSVYLSKI